MGPENRHLLTYFKIKDSNEYLIILFSHNHKVVKLFFWKARQPVDRWLIEGAFKRELVTDRKVIDLPFREAVFQSAGTIAVLAQLFNRLEGQHAIRATTVGNDLLVMR